MKKTVVCLLCLLVLFTCGTVFAGSSTFSGIVLPAFKGDVEFSSKSKTTNTDYYYTRLDYMGGSYDKINAWFERPSGTNITDKRTCTEGFGYYGMSGNLDLSIGDLVVLNIENYTNTTVRVEVDGAYIYN